MKIFVAGRNPARNIWLSDGMVMTVWVLLIIGLATLGTSLAGIALTDGSTSISIVDFALCLVETFITAAVIWRINPMHKIKP